MWAFKDAILKGGVLIYNKYRILDDKWDKLMLALIFLDRKKIKKIWTH